MFTEGLDSTSVGMVAFSDRVEVKVCSQISLPSASKSALIGRSQGRATGAFDEVKQLLKDIFQ